MLMKQLFEHRYLDLRRPEMQNIFIKNKTINYEIFRSKRIFEIETPILGNLSTERLSVPSRINQGHHGLPQCSNFKQLLM